MRSFSRAVVFTAMAVGLASAQPVLREIGNGAVFLPNKAPTSGIPQGGFLSLKGSNLGPASPLSATAYPLGTDLGGTRVRVTVGSTSVDAFPLYTSSGQVNAVLPSTTPIGLGNVQVTYNGASTTIPIEVVRSAFATLTVSSDGTGPAVVTDANYGISLFTTALNPGQVAILWGTGLGRIDGPDNQPATALDVKTSANVKVFVGGKEAVVDYAGRAPGNSGLDQINFYVPAGVSGCSVTVVVQVGTALSNFTTMPVAPAGSRTCSDPTGFSASDLTAISGGTYSVGVVQLSRTATKISVSGFNFDSQIELAFGGFYRYPYDSLIRSSSAAGYSLGNCYVTIMSTASNVTSTPSPYLPTVLDAGAALTLTGPGGVKTLTKGTDGSYSVTLSTGGIPGTTPTPFLSPGRYTVSAPGGSGVGSFNAALDLPAAINWTNQDAISNIPRGQALNITWSGGLASEQVLITGGSSDTNTQTSGSFVCMEQASAGRFTVPSYVLSAMPASSVAGSGVLSIGSYSPGARFSATGLNYGYFGYLNYTAKTVTFQ